MKTCTAESDGWYCWTTGADASQLWLHIKQHTEDGAPPAQIFRSHFRVAVVKDEFSCTCPVMHASDKAHSQGKRHFSVRWTAKGRGRSLCHLDLFQILILLLLRLQAFSLSLLVSLNQYRVSLRKVSNCITDSEFCIYVINTYICLFKNVNI